MENNQKGKLMIFVRELIALLLLEEEQSLFKGKKT
jgi:hypothetical protein